MKYKIKHLSDTFSHPDFRWDGEYFCFEPHKNRNLKYIPINDILSYSQYGISISMNEEKVGTKIYRMNEINNMLCSHNISKYAEIDSDTIQVYKLKDKDILFNRTNSFRFVGRTGMFRKFSNDEIVFASYLVRIRPKSEIITPEYLTVFLNTKYGITDIKRRARSSINQSNVNPEELKRVAIPLLSRKLQQKITSLFDEAFSLLQKSELKYNEAQSLLLSELGLTDWKPNHQLVFIKKYSNVEESGRMDAEYFQPKYEEIIKKIRAYKEGWCKLGNLVNMKKGTEVGSKEYSEQGIPFIRVSNLHPQEITEEKYISEELYSAIKKYQPQEGEILLTKDATPGVSYHLQAQPKKMIVSSGILRLTNKETKINNEYLTLFLNSIITKEQINRDVGGSVILHWRPDQIKQILIPILSQKKQIKIQKLVIDSLNLHKKSKTLLEYSKYAVETAIEKNEKTATAWLKAKLLKPFH